MTERTFNLVVPLGHKPTAMRTTETAGSSQAALARANVPDLMTFTARELRALEAA